MPGGRDWMPGRRADQLALAKKWAPVVNVNKTAWGITQDELTRLGNALTQVDTWSVTFAQSGKPGDGARLRVAYTELRAIMRIYKTRRFLMPPLKYDDFFDLGLEPPDLVRTPEPVPASIPEIETVTAVIRELRFRFRDFGSRRWALPVHVHGIEFCWGIRDDRPEQITELEHTEIVSSNPLVIPFEDFERGRRVFFAARWFNNTKQTGPWSDIESAFIP